MSQYCVWNDVTAVYEEAANIITGGTANQTALCVKASGIADNHLNLAMHTPVESRDDDTYDPALVEAVACLAADLAAMRRVRDPEELETRDYNEVPFTGTHFGHRGMGLLSGIVSGRIALDKQVTGAEVAKPEVDRSGLSTTNGEIEFRYSGGRFNGDREKSYVLTISSSGGTVAGDDLTFTVVRDNDEEILTDKTVQGSGWIAIENGLEARFRDAASSPLWTENDYVTVVCIPPEEQDVVAGDINWQDAPLG